MTTTLAIIAKAPAAGRSKTRLCPPLTPVQAATLARAALEDTLAAVLATPADRRVLVLEGSPGPWLPLGVDVIAQRGDSLDERLACAFEDLGGPALIVGMDTPQLRPRMLVAALAALRTCSAVIGPATDGGYWAIGLRVADPCALLGVPMSTGETCSRQRTRLASLGLETREIESLRDVDTYADALAVAAQAPGTRFAGALAAFRTSS